MIMNIVYQFKYLGKCDIVHLFKIPEKSDTPQLVAFYRRLCASKICIILMDITFSPFLVSLLNCCVDQL